MSYNRKNLLRKIIEIQSITLDEKKRGVSQSWIYDNLISDRFKISRSTYNRYLGIAAKRELNKQRIIQNEEK